MRRRKQVSGLRFCSIRAVRYIGTFLMVYQSPSEKHGSFECQFLDAFKKMNECIESQGLKEDHRKQFQFLARKINRLEQ
jgi:hypothetical protein